jgi:hypothetical protein
MTQRRCRRRRQRHGVVIVISSCTRRSPQLRVFSDPGAVSERRDGRQQVYPYPSDPWLVTLGLWVRVRSQVWVACVGPCFRVYRGLFSLCAACFRPIWIPCS